MLLISMLVAPARRHCDVSMTSCDIILISLYRHFDIILTSFEND